jgi:ATP-binding cassette subfamily B protein/subfamily B ATP-binding cassette protein MsbA
MRLLLRTIPYLFPFRRLVVLSVVILILDALVDLAAPWTLKIIIDHVIGAIPPPQILRELLGGIADDPIRLLIVMVVGGVLIAVVNNGLTVWNTYIQARIEQGMILRFRSDMFAHAQRLSLAFHDRQRAGAFMYRINYSSAAIGEVPMMVLQLAQALITLIGMFLIVYSLDPALAFLTVSITPGLWLLVRYYARRVEPTMEAVREKEGHSLTMIQEAMSMLRVIIGFGRERYEHKRFTEQGREAVDARVRLTVSQMMFKFAVNVLTATGNALVLGYGIYKVLQADLTLGQLLVTLAYVASVYTPLETIVGATTPIKNHIVNLKSAFGLLDTEPEVAEAPDAQDVGRVKGRIEFRNVSFTYHGRSDTLNDINFKVKPGQLVAIVGPTGAGKTTLISLLPRFYDPKSGSILLDGREIRSLTLDSLRQQFSLVLQEPLLFSASIAENIRYGRLDASQEEIEEAARAANAHDFIARLPNGYETIVGERGAMLSGGERQRIAVARAFLKDAPILILDEPTSSIDSRTESVILDAIDRLAVGRTTFMIAHRLSTVRHSDLIIVLDHGRVVEQGTHEELLERGGVYRQMHDVQAKSGRRRRDNDANGEITSKADAPYETVTAG